MRNLARLTVAVVALAAVSGCQLLLVPCYVCVACAGAGGGGVDVAVDPNNAAPLPEVKRAYLALVTQYHPDKVAQLGPKLQALATEETRRLNHAWNELRQRAAQGPAHASQRE